MTPAQTLLLAKVQRLGTLRCSARKERPIRALAEMGEVTFTIEVQPDAGRGRHRLVYLVTYRGARR